MRRISTVLVSGLILLSGVLTASPANAAASPSSVVAVCTTSLAFNGGVTNLPISGTSGDSFTIQNLGGLGATLTISVPGGYTTSSTSLASTAIATVTIGSSSGVVNGSISGGGCSASSGTLTVTVTSSGGGGGSSSSDSSTPSVETSTPSVETLSLSLAASGATCTGGNPTGYAGTWLTLPSADQCTQSGPTAKSGAKLLGWATSSSFPVARAQAQVDKKWGVIDEVIDGERMIFIPGGMATFVSGSNNLFPIWSA